MREDALICTQSLVLQFSFEELMFFFVKLIRSKSEVVVFSSSFFRSLFLSSGNSFNVHIGLYYDFLFEFLVT
jgi:hypothetical protein